MFFLLHPAASSRHRQRHHPTKFSVPSSPSPSSTRSPPNKIFVPSSPSPSSMPSLQKNFRAIVPITIVDAIAPKKKFSCHCPHHRRCHRSKKMSYHCPHHRRCHRSKKMSCHCPHHR